MTAPASAASTESTGPGREGRIPLAVLAGLVLLALALRLPLLASRRLVEGDGAHYASLARLLLIGDFSGLANPYWSNLWPGVIAFISSLSGLDVVAAGRLASLLAGAALPGLTAVLGARLFGYREGVLAGLGVAVHPWLVQFSTLVFTESFFALLLVALLVAGERTLSAPSLGRAATLGILAGAAVVTRPEAMGAIAVVAAFLATVGWQRREVRKTAAALLVFLALASGFVAARVVLVHRFHGTWDFGQTKGTANLLLGLSAEKERVSSGLTPEGQNSLELELKRWTLPGFVRAHPLLVLRHLGQNLRALGACARRVFPPLPVTMGREAFLGTPLWTALDVASILCLGLAILGLARGLRAPDTRRGAGLCGAALLVHLLGLAPLYVHERMIVVVVPLFLLLLAHGTLVLAARLPGGGWPPWGPGVLFVSLAGLSLFGLLRSPRFDYASEEVVQKEAGLWLHERFSQDLRLMTASPQVAFYFYDSRHQRNVVDLPWAEYEALLSFARQKKVHLVAAPDWQLEAAGFPSASQLVPEAIHPGLVYVASVGLPPRRVHVFRVDPAPAPAGSGEGATRP